MAFLNARKAKTGAGVSGMFFVESSKDPVYAVRNRSHNTQVVIIGFADLPPKPVYWSFSDSVPASHSSIFFHPTHSSPIYAIDDVFNRVFM